MTDNRIKLFAFLAILFTILGITAGAISLFFSSRIKSHVINQTEQIVQNKTAAKSVADTLSAANKKTIAELEQLKKRLDIVTAESDNYKNRLSDVLKKLDEAEKAIVLLKDRESKPVENVIQFNEESTTLPGEKPVEPVQDTTTPQPTSQGAAPALLPGT